MARLYLTGVLLIGALAGCERVPERTEVDVRPPDTTADDTPTIEERLDLARQAYDASELDRARDLYLEVLAAARLEVDSVGETEALTWLGLTAWKSWDPEGARRFGEEALALKLRYGQRQRLEHSYNALGLAAWEMSDRLVDAADLFEKAWAAATEHGDSVRAAVAQGNLGLIELSMGDFDSARVHFEHFRDVGRQVGNALYEGNALVNLGMLHIAEGDPWNAVPILEDALAVHRSFDNRSGEQIALAHLAGAYAELGEPRLALAILDTARALSRAIGEPDEEARNLEDIASIHKTAGNNQRALDLYEEAGQRYAEHGLDLELGTALRSAAEVHAAIGNPSGAVESAVRALGLHQAIGDRFEELTDLILLAELSHLAGDANEATRYLEQARELQPKVDAVALRLSLTMAEARIAAENREYQRVQQVLSAAESDLARATPAVELEVLRLWARSHASLGDFESAATFGRAAVDAAERARGRYASSVFRTSYLNERSATYTDLVEVLLRLGHREEAFQVADAARGRALAEHLASSNANAQGMNAGAAKVATGERILRRLDVVLSRLDTLEMWYSDEERDPLTVKALRAEAERLRSDYEGFTLEVAETNGVQSELIGVQRVDVGELMRALGDDEALIEYLVAENRVTAFVVTRDDIVAVDREVTREDLYTRVRLARDLVGDPEAPHEMASTVLQGLHDALIGPIERAGVLANTRTLMIVPHATLNYLPFAALQDPVTERYLVQDFVLINLPVAAAVPALREARRASVSLADQDVRLFAPFPRDLPHTRAEVRAIADAVDGTRRFEGNRGTEAQLREALASGAVVHAATHGIMNVRNPMFSRIALVRPRRVEGSANDGKLEVHELVGLSVSSPLVFLSGCETGVGASWSTQFARGEDYATLAQAFLLAGATNVVATLWRVQDEGAAAFAERFYAELGSSEPAVALAGAQRRSLLDGRYSAPYYWAAYQLSGTGEMRVQNLGGNVR